MCIRPLAFLLLLGLTPGGHSLAQEAPFKKLAPSASPPLAPALVPRSGAKRTVPGGAEGKLAPSASPPLEAHTIKAHGGKMIIGVDYAPSGQLLATSGWDKQVRIWNPTTGKLIRQLEGHKGAVYHVAFAPNGKWLASASADRTLRIWNPVTGEELLKLDDANSGLRHIAFSPDSQLIVSGTSGGTVHAWNLVTGKHRVISKKGSTADGVAFSPDGKYLAIGRHDGTITLWEVRTGKQVRAMNHQPGKIWMLAFAPDGRTLLATSHSSSGYPTAVYDVATGKFEGQLERHRATTLAFSPGGWMWASGSGRGGVYLWEVTTRTIRGRLGRHNGIVPTVAFSPDGKQLASVGHDGYLRVWNVMSLHNKQKRPATEETTKGFWEQLGSTDGEKAFEAILALACTPKHTIPLFRKHLRPVPPLRPADKARIGRLIEQLDADRFQTRRDAFRALRVVGEPALPHLEQALKGKSSLEARRRIQNLLKELRPEGMSVEQRRTLRAVEVLERMGTKEASQLLEKLSRGKMDALATHLSRAALQRLQKEGKK